MRLVRNLHKYFGLVLVALVILVSVTGLLLMHARSLRLNTVMVKMPGYASQAPLDAWKAVPLPDGSVLSLILLSLTGVWIWWYPRHRRHVARTQQARGSGAVVSPV